MKEKKDSVILKAFLPLWFFSFSSAITRAFPWPIKGKAGRPMKGIPELIDPSRSDTDPHKSTARTYSRAAIELSAPTHSFH